MPKQLSFCKSFTNTLLNSQVMVRVHQHLKQLALWTDDPIGKEGGGGGRGWREGGEGGGEWRGGGRGGGREVKEVSSLLSNCMLSRSLRVPTHPRGDPPVVVNIVRSSVPVLPHFPPWTNQSNHCRCVEYVCTFSRETISWWLCRSVVALESVHTFRVLHQVHVHVRFCVS